MKVVRSIEEARAAAAGARTEGNLVGLVPTMGALHEGHLSLIREARSVADVTIVSIFVNPLQFGPREDFSRYPRPEEKDLELADQEKVDIVFLPRVDDMYPPGAEVRVAAGRLGTVLEGAIRPGHFDGVCTVVAKLFNIVRPDVAFFGQKDAQQAAVLKRMVRDLSFGVRIEVGPTVRESDGLALSSRNAFLSPDDRAVAPALFLSLEKGAEVVRSGGDAGAIESAMAQILAETCVEVDYARVVDPEDLNPWAEGPALLVVAARLGSTRLIDNVLVHDVAGERGDTR